MDAKNGLPVTFDRLLKDNARKISSTINCVQIGRVYSMNPDDQTIVAECGVMRVYGEGDEVQHVKYPLFPDVPYFVLQGGNAYIDMPIRKGDWCLLLFNDRCIDTWWDKGAVAAPPERRMHSLSDAFALVGINPSTSVRDYDGNALRLFGDEIHLNGNDKAFVTWGELDSALSRFVTSLNLALTTTPIAGNGAPQPTWTNLPTSIDISAAKTTTVKTGG